VDEVSFGSAEFERLLGDTRRALETLRNGDGASGDSGEPLRGKGTAVDGKIEAAVASGGHLETLTVDPRLMRLGSAELCERIVEAVNAAMDDLRAQTAQSAPVAADPVALAGMLEDLQAESARQMARFTQGVAEAVAKISVAAGGDTDER
jgi:hypothetical protein